MSANPGAAMPGGFLLPAAASAVLWLASCEARRDREVDHGEASHHHVAAHGGCLNDIEGCEIGHAEVRIDDDTFRLWFVGGGNDTGRAVRVPDAEITLAVTLEDEPTPRELALQARPIELAEESPGDCSHFEGRADWLRGVAELTASGSVTFRGARRELEIRYPHGHHDHGEGHSHEEHPGH